jgi:rhodanese-related sulfurtransferase
MKVAVIAFMVIAFAYTVVHSHTDLTPAEVKAILDAGGDVVVLDVREESEYCDTTTATPGHVMGAINMPWNSGYLQDHYGELDPNDSTIVVCRSGNRSNSAANFLDGVGFTSVFDMLGGMNAWDWETELCDISGIVPAVGSHEWGAIKALFR